MRLINSDKFKEKLDYLNYELYNSHPVGELSKEEKDIVSWFIQHISKMVDNMPMEDAIPVEWLLKRAELCTIDYANCLHYSVEAWQTEQKYIVNGKWKFPK